jgi:hypothetical protein
MTFNIEPVPAEEIAQKARGRWAVLTDALYAAHEQNTGVFLSPFTEADGQNIAQSMRKGLAARDMRIRWRKAERNGNAGMYVWIERRL